MSCYPQNWVIYTTINPHCFIYLTLCRYLPQKLKFHWFLMRRLTAGAWSRQLTRASNVSPIFGSNTWPCRDTKTDRFFFSSQTKTLRQDVRRTKTHNSYLTHRGLVIFQRIGPTGTVAQRTEDVTHTHLQSQVGGSAVLGTLTWKFNFITFVRM